MRCCLINRDAWSGCAKLKIKCPRPISIGVIKEQSAKSQQSDECLIIEVFRDMQEGVADLGTSQATTDQAIPSSSGRLPPLSSASSDNKPGMIIIKFIYSNIRKYNSIIGRWK